MLNSKIIFLPSSIVLTPAYTVVIQLEVLFWQHSTWYIFFQKGGKPLVYFKKKFICLAVMGLSCSMWTFSCGVWDLVPCPGIKPGPLHREHGVFVTGPPGKSSLLFDRLLRERIYSKLWNVTNCDKMIVTLHLSSKVCLSYLSISLRFEKILDYSSNLILHITMYSASLCIHF